MNFLRRIGSKHWLWALGGLVDGILLWIGLTWIASEFAPLAARDVAFFGFLFLPPSGLCLGMYLWDTRFGDEE